MNGYCYKGTKAQRIKLFFFAPLCLCSKVLFIIFFLCATFFSSSFSFAQKSTDNYLYRCNEKLVEVVMEDLFNPPVSSRIYVYPNIAAYEVLAIGNPQLLSLSGQIKHLPKLKMQKAHINYSIAAEFAYTTVAKKLVFSEYMITDFENAEKEIWKKKNIDTALINNSIAYGINAGRQLIEWVMKDNYTYIKTLQRYVLNDSAAAWKPTAPEYTNALEPNWPLMRPLATDSSCQIKCKATCAYDESKSSDFYQQAMQVYQTSISLDTAKKLIAWFWDDNPSISNQSGHITYFVHKISPGGHWIKITGQAITHSGLDELKTAETYTLVTIGLYEGFLSCWSEKFRFNSIRPETYIQRLIDPKWLPYIQTPPFPEYPSGHSIISRSAATILTQLIPQPYSFTDSSEMYINIPPRKFNSFIEAAQEAGLSRFYGGIHFMPAIINGEEQGKQIGAFILSTLHTRK